MNVCIEEVIALRVLLDGDVYVDVLGWVQCTSGEPALDGDGRAGGEKAGVYHGGHQPTRYIFR
jgi:hypothetical protein